MLLSCGDALVDFLPVTSVDGRDAAVPVAGGSCLNIAVGMARLGAPAGFVGRHFDRSFRTHHRRPRAWIPRSTFAMRRAARIRRRLRSSATSGASRNMRSMTRRRRPETGPIGTGSIPFDEIEAIHVGSTTLANDKGAAQALAMIEDAGRLNHHLLRSELPAQPGQAQGALRRSDGCVCRRCRHRADVGCRF